MKPGDLLVVVDQGKLFDTNHEAAPDSSPYPATVETIFDGNSILREPKKKL